MATFAEFQGYPGMIGYLKRLQGMHKTPEFEKMVNDVKAVLDKDWRDRVVNGVDREGREVPGQAGIQARRKGKYLGKRGAPGTPFGTKSRLHSRYHSGMVRDGSKFTYIGRVTGVPFAKFLIARFRYDGVSPKAKKEMLKVMDTGMLKLLRSGHTR